jgi:hypothetical protein
MEACLSFRNWTALALCTLLTTPSFADFRYDETTQITGGSIVGLMKFAGAFSKDARKSTEATTSTVLVQGNRMAHINSDTTEIIDLDKETITTIDHKKKQYTVVTFDQMKQQMEAATKKAKEQQAKAKPTEPQPSDAPPPPKTTFKVSVKNTGAAKNVAGLDAKESILYLQVVATDQQSGQSGNLAMTNDLWMAPEIPGYDQVRDFNRRFALKMGAVFGDTFKPTVAAMQPGSTQGMAEMAKEMSKLKGVPVMQVMRMGSTTDGKPLLAASEAPLPASNSPSAGDVAKQGAASALANKLGGLGGFGGFGKKKDQPAPDAAPASQPANPTQAVLMESNTQLAGFSSAPIDASQFGVPAGYAQIVPDTSH